MYGGKERHMMTLESLTLTAVAAAALLLLTTAVQLP